MNQHLGRAQSIKFVLVSEFRNPKRAKESMIKIRYFMQAKTKGGGGVIGVHNLFVVTWCYPRSFFSTENQRDFPAAKTSAAVKASFG